ncbi:MAG TPA: hypothetical protein VE978_18270 [Chitinophagales bacterium]|nr:hypothetical protein [Chitinophagales bacterium]
MKKIFLHDSFACLLSFLPLAADSQGAEEFPFKNQDHSMISGKRLEYYPDGNVKEEQYYKNGKPDSLWTHYFRNGKVQAIGEFKNGKLNGYTKTFDEEGRIACECLYLNNKLILQHVYKYHKNGNLWVEMILNEKKPWTILVNYNTEGIPQDKGDLKGGNGTLMLYDEANELYRIEHYKKGRITSNENIKSDPSW